MWWAPSLVEVLVWLKFWKKKSRDIATTGEKLTVTKAFYDRDEAKIKVPRAGGLLIWVTAIVFALFFWILLKADPTNKLFQFLNFVSRRWTFIPIGTLFVGSIIGFIDDALATLESGGNYKAGGGLKLSHRIVLVTILSFLIGVWFYFKLNLVNVDIIPGVLNLKSLGADWLIIPMTTVSLVALWSSSVIDGFDGLAAGTFIPIYLCFASIAFIRGFFDIATLMMVLVGSMVAYLWFNISPARFFMGDTGCVGVLLTLGVVAFLTNTVYILPIAGIMLVITSGSNIIQILSKKIRKKKVFLAAPFHHHLEGLGWSRSQVTARYWIVTVMASALGLVFGLLVR